MSGLMNYLFGALVYYDHLWIATTLSVASLLLLELKTRQPYRPHKNTHFRQVPAEDAR